MNLLKAKLSARVFKRKAANFMNDLSNAPLKEGFARCFIFQCWKSLSHLLVELTFLTRLESQRAP